VARQRLRRVGIGLLPALIAAGLVFVGIGGLGGHPRIFAVGFWLVTLSLVVLLLLHRGPPPR
jgi:hypothetical protein